MLQLQRYMASVAIAKIVTTSIPLPCAKRKLRIKVLGRLPEVSKNLWQETKKSEVHGNMMSKAASGDWPHCLNAFPDEGLEIAWEQDRFEDTALQKGRRVSRAQKQQILIKTSFLHTVYKEWGMWKRCQEQPYIFLGKKAEMLSEVEIVPKIVINFFFRMSQGWQNIRARWDLSEKNQAIN